MENHRVPESSYCESEGTICEDKEDLEEHFRLRFFDYEVHHQGVGVVAEIEQIVVPAFGLVVEQANDNQNEDSCYMVGIVIVIREPSQHIGGSY